VLGQRKGIQLTGTTTPWPRIARIRWRRSATSSSPIPSLSTPMEVHSGHFLGAAKDRSPRSCVPSEQPQLVRLHVEYVEYIVVHEPQGPSGGCLVRGQRLLGFPCDG
jgi:hypothetical protein